MVGLWAADDTDQWSDNLQGAIGADHYATSARDMIEACTSVVPPGDEADEPAARQPLGDVAV